MQKPIDCPSISFLRLTALFGAIGGPRQSADGLGPPMAPNSSAEQDWEGAFFVGIGAANDFREEGAWPSEGQSHTLFLKFRGGRRRPFITVPVPVSAYLNDVVGAVHEDHNWKSL